MHASNLIQTIGEIIMLPFDDDCDYEIEEEIDYHDPDLWLRSGSFKRWLGDDDEV